MANVEAHGPNVFPRPMREDSTREVAAGGSFTEALAGIGAVVLAILGLLGILPFTFAAIGTIVLGGALVVEGVSIATRLARLYGTAGAPDTELNTGLSAELLTGIAAIALGVLALIGVDRMIMLPVAVIVLGAGLLFGSAATARVNTIAIGGYAPPDVKGRVAHESVYGASAAQVLVGIAAIVLGILGLVGTTPLELTLVAILALGASIMLAGAAVGGRLMAALHH